MLQQYGLEFLSVTDCKGEVVIRTREPYLTGDDRSKDSLIRHALEGRVVGSTEIISREQLALEGALLDARAYLKLVPTPRAKPLEKTEETSGMVMEAAVPVRDERGEILGVVYGGVLLNRNYEIVDDISEMVYGDGQYHGKRVGSATVFQRDERIATTILSASGERAIGTRVSSAVYDAVLQKGDRWVDRAFVVDDWYIAAYEPVRNTDGEIVGMLYVGLLERPYVDMKRNLMLAVLGFAAVGMAVALGLATVLGKAITRPVTELVRGTQRIAAGELSCRIARPTTDEIGRLADAFNTMAQSLQETIGEKDRLNAELRRSEQTLKELNVRYLELLGFLTHEFIQPLTVLKGYLVMLESDVLGELTSEKQRRAVAIMHRSVRNMTDVTRKYLDWSKIEAGELFVRRERTRLYRDVLCPAIEDLQDQLAQKNMSVTIQDEDRLRTLEVDADPVLLGVVYNNLLGNAVKYGRRDGRLLCGIEEQRDFYSCTVKNEGNGIAEADLSRVFEKFVRLDSGQSERPKGTGLGLYNVKTIVEEHGGRIWAESVEGAWTSFIFTLPKTQRDRPLQKTEQQEAERSRRDASQEEDPGC